MKLKTLDNLDLEGKKILLRCDLNVPFDLEGKVSDSTKIERHKITIDELIHKGARVIIMSHLGRPNGNFKESLSLSKVLKILGYLRPLCTLFYLKQLLKMFQLSLDTSQNSSSKKLLDTSQVN